MGLTSWKNRKCLITGAAGGIVAAQGAQVILTDIDAVGLLTTARDAAQQGGGRVLTAQAVDLTDFEAVRRFAGSIHEQHGSLDVVMNVAGISIWGSIETLEHRHWRKVVEVDLMGPIHVLECFVPPMISAGRGGYVVNVSSAAGLVGLPWHAAYSAAKFGLRGVSEVLRFDLERHGIGVCLVCPGAVDTGLVDTAQIAGFDEDAPALARLRERFRKRAIRPEQAATAILRGLKAGRYLVFTSGDIQLLHWLQRRADWLYAAVMRRINDELYELLSGKKQIAPF
jgi:NAD(P)-dependent dehydrogenase (short-subunit alcohol dehydrogenase family)